MPDLEALWSVRLRSLVPGATGYSQYEAAGVVVLETDRLFGGDSSYYYTGTYSTRNGRLLSPPSTHPEPTYKSGKTVQITGTTSVSLRRLLRRFRSRSDVVV